MAEQNTESTTMSSRRLRFSVSTSALDSAEQDWWERYGEVEDLYCWVQTPAIQQVIRGRYLQSIATRVPRNCRVLDLGCGTGWLSSLLASYGAAEVHGVDFSAEQIRRAREQRRPGSVHFHQLTGPLADAAPLAGLRFDAVVIHALLHHLSDEEVGQLLRDLVFLAAPGCRVFILEPVFYASPARTGTRIRGLVNRLVLLPRMGKRSGVRKVSPREAELTELIDSRGDSPKETPFLPDELDALLSPTLEVARREPVLCFSFLVAKNLLLLSVTYPVLGAILLRTYLPLARALEQVLLLHAPQQMGLPVFELLECRQRADGAAACGTQAGQISNE